MLEAGAGLEFIDDRERVYLPHRCLSPEAFKLERDLAVVNGEIEVGETEVSFEPSEKGRFEDAARAVEGVAGQPDQFRFVEAQLARRLKLLAKFTDIDDVAQRNVVGAIHQRECGARFLEMLPDELEHQQLVEVGVEQRSRDGIELPVMVVRAACQVDDHCEGYCIQPSRGCPRVRADQNKSVTSRLSRAGHTSATCNQLVAYSPPPHLWEESLCFHGIADAVPPQSPVTIRLNCRVLSGKDMQGKLERLGHVDLEKSANPGRSFPRGGHRQCSGDSLPI